MAKVIGFPQDTQKKSDLEAIRAALVSAVTIFTMLKENGGADWDLELERAWDAVNIFTGMHGKEGVE